MDFSGVNVLISLVFSSIITSALDGIKERSSLGGRGGAVNQKQNN
jgi:hypothetical protein